MKRFPENPSGSRQSGTPSGKSHRRVRGENVGQCVLVRILAKTSKIKNLAVALVCCLWAAGCADTAHNVVAVRPPTISVAAAPIVGARYLARSGRRRSATASIVVGVASGAFLLASVLSPRAVGLSQRIGLTLGDTWIVLTALGLAF